MSQQVDSDWDVCPEGAIGSMMKRHAHQRRIRSMKIYGGVATVVLLIGFTLFAVQPRWGVGHSGVCAGGLWCDEVASHLADYSKGQVDAELSKKMFAHLSECEHCSQKYEEMKSQEKTVALTDWSD